MSPRTLLRWLVLALGLAAALAAGAGRALAESSSSGARALQAGLLALAGAARPPDALVADLCSRLEAAGMPVLPNLAAPDWALDVAVLDGLVPGRGLLAVEVDGPAYAACPSVRFRDRQRRQAWERAGWVHLRVAAMDLFCDPDAEVERIHDAWRAAGGLPASVVPAEVLPVVAVREPFPDVATGLPPSAYGPKELETVARWAVSDGVQRTDEEVAATVREALGIVERGGRADVLVAEAVRAVNPRVVVEAADGAAEEAPVETPGEAPVEDAVEVDPVSVAPVAEVGTGWPSVDLMTSLPEAFAVEPVVLDESEVPVEPVAAQVAQDEAEGTQDEAEAAEADTPADETPGEPARTVLDADAAAPMDLDEVARASSDEDADRVRDLVTAEADGGSRA